MVELFKILGLIVIDNDEANKKLDNTTGKAESTFNKIGKGSVAVGKAVGKGMLAAGTAVAGLVTQSTNAYAAFEQLKGGVETLFKDSAQTVLDYANQAFQTAGLSANQYMETVTSFSASLIQSLGGDTAKAAEYADMAIRDMSDNANKMGTSMSAIQTAYQGFAKQNYTMLDNLKLGYGGTSQEMYRLLCDAKEIDSTFDAVFSIDSKGHLVAGYADIVKAINIVQTEMGITGTTAQEAAGTISGSAASVKAAWQNVMMAMADENANLSSYIQTFVDTAETALGNFIPRIGIALEGVVDLVGQLAPQIIQKIPGLIEQLLPAIIQASVGLVNSIIEIFPQLMNTLFTTVLPQLLTGFATIFSTLFVSIAEFITTNLPILTEKATEMMTSFGAKIEENLPNIISKGLDILTGLSETILENIPVLVSVGMDLIMSLVKGIIDALPELIAKAPQIIINFADTISASMTTIFAKGIEIIWALIKGIIGAIPDLIKNLPKVIEAIFSVWNAVNWTNMGKNLMNGIKNGIQNMGGSLKNAAKNIFDGLKQTITHPMESAKTLVKGVIDKIKGFFNFKISWPKVPLPKFAISPKGWGIGDLLDGVIPKLSIDWYAKAMDNPIIMSRPTVFGYNGATGQLMAGGEAGTEVVSGADTLMNMIQTAVAAQNDAMIDCLNVIIDMLSAYFPEFRDAMRTPATFDPDAAARVLAAPMNRELGRITALKGRGR